jgi:hypothetical protein
MASLRLSRSPLRTHCAFFQRLLTTPVEWSRTVRIAGARLSRRCFEGEAPRDANADSSRRTVLIAASTPAHAQVVPNTFGTLPALLKPGDQVAVIDAGGLERSGRIADLSATGISIDGGHGNRRFGEADVVVIRQLKSDSLLNGMLIGLAVGGGVGMIAELACGGDDYMCGKTGQMTIGSTVWGVGIARRCGQEDPSRRVPPWRPPNLLAERRAPGGHRRARWPHRPPLVRLRVRSGMWVFFLSHGVRLKNREKHPHSRSDPRRPWPAQGRMPSA